MRLSYIEGWYAISQANEIFGYGGWDRETVHFERVHERSRGDAAVAGYTARVRIRVRAGGTEVLREGTGWGWATARSIGEAHERALKTAETDATKRALSTFGASFGLNLYDKEQNRVERRIRPTLTLFTPDGRSLSDTMTPEGFSIGLRQLIEVCKTTDELDALTRHNATQISDLRARAPALRNINAVHFADLLLRLIERARRKLDGQVVALHPDTCDPKVAPFPVRETSFQKPPPPPSMRSQLAAMTATVVAPGPVATPAIARAPEVPSADVEAQGEGADSRAHAESAPGSALVEAEPSTDQGRGHRMPASFDPGATTAATGSHSDHTAEAPAQADADPTAIDKSQLAYGHERRYRSKEHLRKVGELPCTICNRQPSHAHHLRFAQKRGMSQKVSDEFVVPLCALHHGQLHQTAAEQDWWDKQNINPLPIAQELWGRYREN